MSESLSLLHTAIAALGGQQRSGQESMLALVDRAITEQEHLLVQAGTGTGKSLAYLIPLIRHSMKASTPAIISTATLALQSQIVRRDVPKLIQALEPELDRTPTIEVLKGRGNYVCKHKLGGGYPSPEQAELFDAPGEGGVEHPEPSSQDPMSKLGKDVKRITQWAQESETGDRDELRPGVSERAWRQFSVTAKECLGTNSCPMAAECFSELARAKANKADVVVTNHAMLALAAFDNPSILPEFDTVVVDEAHELADRVTQAVTGSISASMVFAADTLARKHGDKKSEELVLAGRELERALAVLDAGWLKELPAVLASALSAVHTAARAASSKLSGGGSGAKKGEDVLDGGTQLAKSALADLVEVSARLLEGGKADSVIWVQGDDFGKDPAQRLATLNIAPLSVAMKLRDGLFDERTVILTSATLAVGAEFGTIAGQLGLAGEQAPDYLGVDVGSPFDYPKQGVLYVAKHLPAPRREDNHEQLDELVDLIQASGGGALGLFSSRRGAEEAAEYVSGKVQVPILCQGESSMEALVSEFAQEPDTCLFGTLGLWQGVDVPGRSCRLVVIDRIPFPRPNDPLVQARTEDAARHRRNGFMSVSAHHAAIKLAQGAGRLIRSMDDRGVVAVLDSRLVNARYGSYLAASLPPMWRTVDKDVVTGILGRLNAEPR